MLPWDVYHNYRVWQLELVSARSSFFGQIGKIDDDDDEGGGLDLPYPYSTHTFPPEEV